MYNKATNGLIICV